MFCVIPVITQVTHTLNWHSHSVLSSKPSVQPKQINETETHSTSFLSLSWRKLNQLGTWSLPGKTCNFSRHCAYWSHLPWSGSAPGSVISTSLRKVVICLTFQFHCSVHLPRSVEAHMIFVPQLNLQSVLLCCWICVGLHQRWGRLTHFYFLQLACTPTPTWQFNFIWGQNPFP